MWQQVTPATATPTHTPKAAPRSTQGQPRPTLAEAVRLFLKRSEAKGLSPRTVQFYRERLGVFLRWLDAERVQQAEPGDVSAAAIREFLAQEKQRTSAATAKHAHAALSAVFGFLHKEQALADNPMRDVEKPRTPKKQPSPLRADDVERMLGACGAGFLGARLRALLLVLVDTGLRLSEVCGLRLEDASLDEQALKVMGKGSKERVVPFGEATRQALMDYLARRGELAAQDWLFVTVYGDPMRGRQVHQVLENCGKRAGVAGVHPHRLRHTFAVMFLQRGGHAFALMRALGHTSLEMTRRYVSLADTDLRETHRACSPGDRFLAAVKPTNGRKRLR